MRRKILALMTFVALVITISGCAKQTGGSDIISNFENAKIWDTSPETGFSLTLSREHVTEGDYSLKIIYPVGRWPSINSKRLPFYWKDYDYLCLDVFNPQEKELDFVVRLDDSAEKRANLDCPLKSGWNYVKIPRERIAQYIDPRHISFVVLFLNRPSQETTLYFDNMRLCHKDKETAPTGTKSGESQQPVLVAQTGTSIDKSLPEKIIHNLERPRLFFTTSELVYLREKFYNGPLWLKEELINYAENEDDIFVLGFMYQLLKDKIGVNQSIENFARRAIDAMLTKTINSQDDLERFALAFDWCYEKMDKDERVSIVRKIEKAALELMSKSRSFRSFHNTMYQATTSIAAAGFALEKETDLAEKFIEFAEEQYNDALLMFNNIFIEGEWPEGLDYNRHIAFPLVKYFEMVRTATGKDLYKECDWLLKNAYFIMYTTRPDNTFYRFADNDFPTITDWERRFLVRVASYYKDPYIQWYIKHKTKPHDYTPRHIYDLLWLDPELEEKPPYDLPKAKFFRGLGVVIARSGWDENSTWFSFKCGDYFGDHCHLDSDSFTIYKEGSLAIDSGLYGDDWGSSHMFNYYQRTIAHNTILVDDPDEKFYGYEGRPLVNDGGQKIMLWEKGERVVPENYIQPDPSLHWTWVKNKERWDIGDIKGFKLTEEYCFMAGDATKSYSSHKLSRFTRNILFIFPDYFIIFDTVSSTKPDFKKKWLLHTVNEPQINNEEIIVTEGKGKLYCKVLYPLKILINKIGGEGEEFLVNDKNYPHNNKLFSGNVPGSWRVEIESLIPKKEDMFLNFFYTSKIDGNNIPKIKKIDSNNGLGITLDLENLTWVAIFSEEKKNNSITYSVEKKEKVRNLIFNPKPNEKYEIKHNNKVLKIVNSDECGILDFEIENLEEGVVEVNLLTDN